MKYAMVMLVVALIGCGSGGEDVGAVDAAATCEGATGCSGECELGNDYGVGRYCTPAGGECADTPSRLAPFCTADQGADIWFCTRPCQDDVDCGGDAICRGEDENGSGPKGCVPNFCL